MIGALKVGTLCLLRGVAPPYGYLNGRTGGIIEPLQRDLYAPSDETLYYTVQIPGTGPEHNDEWLCAPHELIPLTPPDDATTDTVERAKEMA